MESTSSCLNWIPERNPSSYEMYFSKETPHRYILFKTVMKLSFFNFYTVSYLVRASDGKSMALIQTVGNDKRCRLAPARMNYNDFKINLT